MKNKFTLFTSFLISATCQARPLNVGVEAGLSSALSKQSIALSWSASTNVTTTNIRLGARFGIPIHFELSKKISINSGLFSTAKGINENPDGNISYANISYNNFELPMALVFNFKENKKKFFIGGGVYLGYAFKGKLRFEGSQGQILKKAVRFGNNMDIDDMRRLDYGLHFQTGVAFQNGLLLRFVAQRQLNDLAIKNNIFGFNQIKNQGFIAITMAYLF